jgi:MFS family permease
MRDPRHNVRLLAAARVCALSGQWASYAALTYALYTRTGSTAYSAAGSLVTICAQGILAPIGGSLADRFDRQRLMISADALTACAFVLLALVHQPVVMILVATLASAVSAPFLPASRAAVANLAADDDLNWANGLIGRATATSFLAGPIIGGLLIGPVGASGVFLLAAAGFASSAVIISRLRGRFAASTTSTAAHTPGVRAGVVYIARERLLRALVIAEAVGFAGVGFAVVADPPLARLFHAGGFGYGLMLACWGGGSLVGAVVAGRLSRGSEMLGVVLGLTVMGIGLILVWPAPVFAAVLGVSMIGGFGNGIADVARTTLLQIRTPDEVRGRVFAAADAAGMAVFAASISAAGGIVAAVGPKASYALSGAFFLVGAVVVVALAGTASLRRGAPISEATPS